MYRETTYMPRTPQKTTVVDKKQLLNNWSKQYRCFCQGQQWSENRCNNRYASNRKTRLRARVKYKKKVSSVLHMTRVWRKEWTAHDPKPTMSHTPMVELLYKTNLVECLDQGHFNKWEPTPPTEQQPPQRLYKVEMKKLNIITKGIDVQIKMYLTRIFSTSCTDTNEL